MDRRFRHRNRRFRHRDLATTFAAARFARLRTITADIKNAGYGVGRHIVRTTDGPRSRGIENYHLVIGEVKYTTVAPTLAHLVLYAPVASLK